MKNLAWIVPLGVFVVFLIISLAIVAPYKIYKNQEQKINELQNNSAVAQRQIRGADTTKTDIKQDIRTFLESLNPEILAKVDARVKEVGVWLGPVNQVKLTSLSDRPEFSKFLSFKKTEHVWMVAGEGKLGDFIRPIGETGTLVGYYLYPKDALIK